MKYRIHLPISKHCNKCCKNTKTRFSETNKLYIYKCLNCNYIIYVKK